METFSPIRCAIYTRKSTDEGLERAIVQFCLSEMDYMFKQPSTVYKRYLKK